MTTRRKRKSRKMLPVAYTYKQHKGRIWRLECFIDYMKLLDTVGKGAIDAKLKRKTMAFGAIKITAREDTL